MAKKVLITAALPYVNNVPHLGNLVPTLSADVYARFLRLAKHDVLFICGTDEHGTTTEVKAIEEGVTPQEICDKYFKIHKEVYDWFHCSFDCFGRTSSEANKKTTYEIFNDLDENGYLLKQPLKQARCPKCERFLADRFVVGMCPHCDYVHARGDQCENCGKLLEPNQLIAAKCKICKTIPEFVDSMHLFMDLPKIEPELREWISEVQDDWSENAKTMTQAWLKEGLKPRCITRDLKWGIKVPKAGFEDKVFYSWFDAPIGYIGITREFRKDWETWWKSEDVRLVQFMGKDNIPFHSIIFPGFLLGTKKSWKLVDELAVNEFINYEGGQFSKSRGVGVFGDSIMQTGIPADAWRYYVVANLPEKMDSDFRWDDFAAKINNELVANLGNLVSRVLTIVNKTYNSIIDAIELNDDEEEFIDKVETAQAKVRVLYEEIKLKDALKHVMTISKMANVYLQENEPWNMERDPVRRSTTIGLLVNVIKDLSILINPVMPGASRFIQTLLNLKPLSWNDLGLKTIKQGHLVQEVRHLFNKVEDEQLGELKGKFGSKSDFFPLNLRVAVVKKVEDHPDADKLYVLKLDLGDHSRQIVAGMKPHYKPDELLGKHIIIVSNLAHAKLRGVNSEGMMLAADKDGVVKVIEAPNSPPGRQVMAGDLKNNDKEITYEEFSRIKIRVLQGRVLASGKQLKSQDEDIVSGLPDGAIVK
ncbi:MAG TPA: methionine--tRNA ligase [Candidatus Nanoarchaeia archaeon]|nr:methionine--tRNA ligase [Candidatus Nanoarchaeia archaeon]